MSTQIKSTTKYDLFELYEFNRDVKNTEKLETSMLKHGWIDAYPMHVIADDKTGLLSIKAGHHRFVAARNLKIPVKYVVCDDKAEVPDL